MNTFTTLHDAFEELERQADAYPADADRPAGAPSGPRRRVRPQQLMLVAATVLVVTALAAGFGLLAGHRSGTTPAGPPTRASLPTRSATSVPPSTVTPSHIATPPTGFPRDAAAVAASLRAVLGSSATFSWSAPAGAKVPVIAGVLTDSRTSHRGGFDLQTLVGNPGDTAVCEDAALTHCTPRTLPDGTSVAVGQETGNGIVYLVSIVRPNGATLVMHVSTNSDPKRGGHSLGNVPPLTTEQIVALLCSPLWYAS